jgi:Recombinase/Recombinase zinc beta ribbon domain
MAQSPSVSLRTGARSSAARSRSMSRARIVTGPRRARASCAEPVVVYAKRMRRSRPGASSNWTTTVNRLSPARWGTATSSRTVADPHGVAATGSFFAVVVAMSRAYERRAHAWDTASCRNGADRAESAIHISARTPTGYRRDEKKRLEREEPAATVVREVFRRRALGASWAELARFLDEEGITPSTGNAHWSKTGVAGLVKNPVYLGQARSGAVVQENAHEALVTRAEFDAAQSTTKSLFAPRDGSVASQAMLGGLVHCAGCGHTLKITGNTDRKRGERYPIYYCTGRYASGLCPSRASGRASLLDAYVEEQVLAALAEEDGLLAQAVDASQALEAASRAVADAEHELDLFIANPKLLTLIGEQKFLEGVEARQRALDEARSSLAELRQQSSLSDELADGDLLRAWPTLTVQDKRRLVHGLLDRVVLTRAQGRGRHARPIGERTQIVLRGNVLLGENPDDAILRRARLAASLDQLNPIRIGISNEADAGAAVAHLVRRPLGLDPVAALELLERAVEVVHADRDVPVPGSDVVRAAVVVVGQLEDVFVVTE